MSMWGIFFKANSFSFFAVCFIIFFSLLIFLYSLGAMRQEKGILRYYVYLLLTTLTALGAVFANHLIVFLGFWGFLGILLFLLISFGHNERTPQTAKKAFIIVVGADAFMIVGIAIVWKLTGTLRMDMIHVSLSSPGALLAYFCFATAAFAKAGGFPFHTWLPDTAEDAPASVSAFFPAALDKFLGIYLLLRLSLDLFQMNIITETFLMAIGSLMIVCAVMMALVQHDLKRLLGYHAVSQIGYTILGIGTGNPVGMAGGLFHMLNNAIYKSCLFLSAGAVEKKCGTTDLDKLGGLSKSMPVVYASFLTASLAISGVPPFNGFASKWMIYQGIIQTSKYGSHLWIIWLTSAMFGSALTLASFMKLVHAVFLGQASSPKIQSPTADAKTPVSMGLPVVVLAFLCVICGIFARQIPLSVFVLPSLHLNPVFLGTWNAYVAAILLLFGMFVGLVIYAVGLAGKARITAPFVGGAELKDYPEMRMSGTAFYKTVEDVGPLKGIYQLAHKKVFDLYEMAVKGAQKLYAVLKYAHNGILPTYLAWCLLGMIVLFYILVK